ncbi:MAG: pyruvate carboxyltransferase [Lachnospiraceae bacterium]|nr:pyruvate carboxyltransferase [Lachnospiraceae bacterium]
MINNVRIFDCTLREVGYQTGWYYSDEFAKKVYKFALGKGIDYVELGFFHSEEADPGKGNFRYCSIRNQEIKDTFKNVKNITKLSAMRDIQRPLSELLPKEESIIDTIRILTRSHETDFLVLAEHVELSKKLGYEVFINYTSAGYNTMEKNKEFVRFAKEMGVESVEFADTESVMTKDYIINTIALCHDENIKVGVHLHDKNGTAEELADLALEQGADYMDVTHLGLGGKWRDGNLTMEYLLRKMDVKGGYESTTIKNDLIEELIKYHEFSVAE